MSVNVKTRLSYLFFCLLAIIVLTKCRAKENKFQFEEYKQESQKTMDTIVLKINNKIKISQFADSITNSDSSISGLKKLDSLVLLYPKNSDIYFQRGVWYHKNKLYNEAISEFNAAEDIAGYSYPNLSEKKAKTFIALNQIEDALKRYKEAAIYSNSYNYDIGKIYETKREIDSALHYYSLYLKKNKNDEKVKKLMDSLVKKRKNP